MQVYDAREWNDHLPRTVEAFFGLFTNNGFNPNGATASIHKAFLSEYGLTADDVPLLDFDPGDWEHPFKAPNEKMVYADVGVTPDQGEARKPLCPQWCATWTCDGAEWCQGGNIPVPCKNCEKT